MPYNISFISLGCAKNQVNCEQMMASVQAAGHTVQAQPEGADVVFSLRTPSFVLCCGNIIIHEKVSFLIVYT